MAFTQGKNADILLGTKDITSFFKKIDTKVTVKTGDTTTLGNSWESSLPTIAAAVVSGDGLYDPSLTDLTTSLLATTDPILTVGPGGLNNIGDLARLVQVQTTDFGESDPVGDIVAFTWAAKGTTTFGIGACLQAMVQQKGPVANGYVVSTNMGNITYTQAATQASDGRPHNVTCTRTVVAGADTPGTVLVTGTDFAGNALTETLTPGANGVLVQGLKAFQTVTSIVGSGWTIATTADTIVFGWGEVTTGVGVDNGAASTTGAIAHLHCSAVSSGDTLTVAIEDSADQTTWAAVASGAFTGLTTAGSQRLIIPGTIRRYVRATPLITVIGTSQATYGVSLART